jgi:hypothetical protein
MIDQTLKDLERERNSILKDIEEQWCQRNHAIWIQSGDLNTKFFHSYASYRRNHKFIWEIQDEGGTVYRGQDNLKMAAVKHFKDFYNKSVDISQADQVKVATLFPNMILDSELDVLYKPVDKEELKKVLSNLKVDKSPGPDGWTVEFFKHFFDLVGDDILEMIEESRTLGFIPGALNSTFITLIPKVNKPRLFGDFRPISLCNLCYKIISKVIANRIKPILSRSLSEEQLGFLQGRQIQDAIGTVHECIHSINQKKSKSLILKLDLQKAYDCVNWDLLRILLLQIGLDHKMTNWIMSCVVSTSYSVLINGEATYFFKSGRGLRQGCPLSPLLFILVMESLSLLLKDSQREGKLSGIQVSKSIKILHILFVDDVIIMTGATIHEWWEIDKVLKLFSLTSGLLINVSKSTFHQSGLTDQELFMFKYFFPYDFIELEQGFKYLGFYLKAGAMRLDEWHWLIKKLENKINNWCFRWLSLGGHLTLLKAVLSSQPIYWMSLAIVPGSVLKILRNRMFNFLWKRNCDSHTMHLCSWERLSLPKSFGGWGIRNIFDFSKSLAANTLWRILMGEGIWHRVIIDKYLLQNSVTNWLRTQSFRKNGISRIWSGLTKVLYLILHGLSWIPGNGISIKIGKDRILGMGDRSFFSSNLLSVLKDQNILTLAQVRKNSGDQSLVSSWLSSTDLELEGDLAREWEQFRSALSASGALIQEKKDTLMWIGGDNSGKPSAKNLYSSIISAKRLLKVDTWKQKIWNWKAQLKVKLFVWLALEGKILTWDTLQKRGWTGLGHCSLCKSDCESVSHLFIYCPFAISVWNLVYMELKLNRSWTGNTLSDCFQSWYMDKSVPTHIAAYSIWYIWQERNKALFEDTSPSVQAVIYKILALSPCAISYPKDKLRAPLLL